MNHDCSLPKGTRLDPDPRRTRAADRVRPWEERVFSKKPVEALPHGVAAGLDVAAMFQLYSKDMQR